MLMRFGQRRRSSPPTQGAVSVSEIDRHAALPSDEYRLKHETLLVLKALNREPSVAYAEPNYLRKPLFTPNDEFYCSLRDPISMDCIDIDLQWHYPLINLPAAWDTTRGANVTVAVIDTGVLLNHPDLENQLVLGYDFISDPGNSLDGDGIDPNPDDPGDGGSFASSSFHGSHVAGTVAAETDNAIGVAGVAGDARILPLRVCGFLGCSSFDIIEAVRYAAGLPNSSGTTINPPVDVINLSLGGGSPSAAEQAAFDAARAAGVVTVAAAGNESTTAPSYPATYQNVISVSAIAIDSSLASYSNRGSTIDVAAPGGDFGPDTNGDGFVDFVLSTAADDSSGLIDFAYVFFAGTSMASPHVAGVIALMKSVNAALTPGQIDQMLANGDLTDDLGAAGRDNSFGYGLINAQKAVAAAQNAGGAPPPDNPTLGVTPSAVNFGAIISVIEITARNVRTGALNLIDFSIPVPWVAVDAVPGQVDAEGLGTYTVTVDRSGLADGIHSTTITANSDVNAVPFEIIVQVSPVPLGSDAGFVYVLLLDAQTGNSAGRCDNDFVTGQCSVSVVNGQYAFTFLDAPPGDYQIVAGTDANNDLFICDAGEACGAYLTIPQPSDITVVDADLSAIDFPIGHTAADGIGGQSQDPGASLTGPAEHRRRR